MDAIAEIILKHDGYIWGEYVWSKILGESPKSIKCRFVSKSLFGLTETLVIPKHFLIDLNHHFKIRSIRKNSITLENGVVLDIFIHGAGDEIDFMRDTDFTCNLLDYRRDGYLVRDSPSVIEYEVSPYETVVRHIKEKKLVPVNIHSALKIVKHMIDDHGWKTSDFIVSTSEEVCSICHETLKDSLCFGAPCGHNHHVKCMEAWVSKNKSCPLCRETIGGI
jgi:hypothetical protein